MTDRDRLSSHLKTSSPLSTTLRTITDYNIIWFKGSQPKAKISIKFGNFIC
ncbi:hypothetical protein Hanom_Chr06g00579351 [Helianthus anomalus]